MSLESINKAFKEKVSNDMKELFEKLKSVTYKKLWSLDDSNTTVLEIVEGKEIHIANDRISFDNGKTFIHRSEEKIIKEKFEVYEKEVVDLIVNQITSESKELVRKIGRVEKARVEKVSDDSYVNDMLNSFKELSEDDQENAIEHIKIMLELNVINDQLELLKEIGGNKEKILSLLEQKHSLIKELRNI